MTTLASKANHIPSPSHLGFSVVGDAQGRDATTYDRLRPINFHLLDTIQQCVARKAQPHPYNFEPSSHVEIRRSYVRVPGIRSIAFPYPSFLLRKGVASWVQHYRSSVPEPRKASDRKVGSPTDLSATLFPTSASLFFGLKIQLQTLLQRVAAAFAKPSDFSAVIANGLALHRPRSSQKFCLVKACATSA